MPFLEPEDLASGDLDIRQLLVRRPSSTFFMRASGDSLDGFGVHDGDLLVVDRSVEPREGDIAVVCECGALAVRLLEKPDEGEAVEVWGSVIFSVTEHSKR